MNDKHKVGSAAFYLETPEGRALADLRGDLRDLRGLMAEKRTGDVMRRLAAMIELHVKD